MSCGGDSLCDPAVHLCGRCLHDWLNRPPAKREPNETDETYEDEPVRVPLVCLVHGTSTCAHDTCPPMDTKGAPFDEQLAAAHEPGCTCSICNGGTF